MPTPLTTPRKNEDGADLFPKSNKKIFFEYLMSEANKNHLVELDSFLSDTNKIIFPFRLRSHPQGGVSKPERQFHRVPTAPHNGAR